MDGKETRVKDPVCGMWVAPSQRRVEYLGMHFAFCSEQCRERFLANPGLYVGSPGHKAPKQEQRELIKQRCFHLGTTLSPEQAGRLADRLRGMMGVKAVEIAGDRLEITYDLLQATAQQIEAEIIHFGAGLDEGWSERIRRAFVHAIEEEQLLSLEVPPPARGGPGHHH